MKTYSLDLRERVLADADAGMKTSAVADKYTVSPAWVRRLKRRRAATGQIGPGSQRCGPVSGRVAGGEAIHQAPDAAPDGYRAEFSPLLSRAVGVRATAALVFDARNTSFLTSGGVAARCWNASRHWIAKTT